MANHSTDLLRPRFFDRQLLRAVDLTLAQEYVRERLRRHNRFLHGWGVVCGARVTRASSADPWSVSIGEGYAVTPLGNEIYIPPQSLFNIEAGAEECLGIPPPCPDPENLSEVDDEAGPIRVIGASIDPASRDASANDNEEWVELLVLESVNLEGYVLRHVKNIDTPDEGRETLWSFDESATFPAGTVIRVHSGAQPDAEEPTARIDHRRWTEPDEAPILRLDDVGDTIEVLSPQGEAVASTYYVPGSVVSVDEGVVYLVACPADDVRCPRPAVPADCQPGGGVYEYSRVCETVQFRVVCELPSSHRQQQQACEELERIACGRAHVPCPPTVPGDDDCVVLASIAVKEDSSLEIDDLSERRQLLSESLLQAYLRCRCETAERSIEGIEPGMIRGSRFSATEHEVAVFGAGLTTAKHVEFADRVSITEAAIVEGSEDHIELLVQLRRDPKTGSSPFTLFFPDGTELNSGSIELRFRSELSIHVGDQPITIEMDPDEFDLEKGYQESVGKVSGIGSVYGDRLREAGVDNVLALATLSPRRTAEIAEVSLERATGWRDQARQRLRR